MLLLNDSLFIGRGKHQEVYEHPENKNLCVKILIDTDPIFLKEEKRNRSRESSYLTRTIKKFPDCGCIVHYYGLVETNRGEGALYGLVRNDDGQISSNLEDYLLDMVSKEKLTMVQLENLRNVLEVLYQDLLKYRIITRNIRPINVCLQKNLDNSIKKLVLIDDLGPTELIPITESISFLAISKVKRKYKRFINLLREYSDKDDYQHMLNVVLSRVV